MLGVSNADAAVVGYLFHNVTANVWAFVGAIVGTSLDAGFAAEMAGKFDCKLR